MKKSKQIFGLIAAVIMAVCLLVILLFGGPGNQASQEQPPSTTPADTAPVPESTEPEESNAPYIPEHGVSGIRNTYTLADNVTITQVPKDPNEVIHAYAPIAKDDPEYLGNDENYETAEGKVYRNDKIISIDLFDELTGQEMKISFGYITGTVNRFLYLNPVVETSETTPRYGFYFSPMPAGGNVLTLPVIYANEEERLTAHRGCYNFQVGRALDQREIAGYQDPKHPGTVWFTPAPIESDLWIDVLVYQLAGDLRATLRLTIAKDPDGTYSIVNLENKNLLQTYEEAESKFTKDELAYIYNIGKTTVENPDIVKFDAVGNAEVTVERMIIEYRNEQTGLYYPFFIPADRSGGFYASSAKYADGPILAVTVRHICSVTSVTTMYFRIIKMPTEREHGKYEYIGRDFLFAESSQALSSQGYPGM